MAGLFDGKDPNILVGAETADDAGVYRLNDETALVETTDIITPLVDDAYTFGRIAAANALSDVYAMGGRPLTAMNLVFFPYCSLPGNILAEILAGGHATIKETGAALVGGHTVEDDELKYGLAVTGVIHPAGIIRNSTARPGDRLILTKPLGTGIVSTAIKADMAPASIEAESITWMTTLNSEGARLMVECRANACTDVTGFGLIGHATEMARGAAVTFSINLEKIPIMDGLMALVADGLVPAGCYRNRDYYSRFISASDTRHERLLPLFDPQTSGGLLISLPQQQAELFLTLAERSGCFAAAIGEVQAAGDHFVEIK